MSMIFSSDNDYEAKLQEFLDIGSMGIGSDFKESIFREQWEREYGIGILISKSQEKRKDDII